MAPQETTWATAHLVRYAQPMTAAQLETLGTVTGPESALTWLYGPDRDDDDDGFDQLEQSAVWVGVGYYPGRAAAEAVFDHPGRALPALGDAVEAWHALLLPIHHRGEFRFCERGRNGELNMTGEDFDPGGRLLVITSTGYETDEIQDSRVDALLKGVVDVRLGMPSTDGVITHHAIDNPNDDLDGMTFSIWRDERAMQAFAYAPGRHRGQIDRHLDRSMFDRSSFTRLRPVRSAGLWNGVDPLGDTLLGDTPLGEE